MTRLVAEGVGEGVAADRILGLPDGSIATLSRAQVEAMVAAPPRHC